MSANENLHVFSRMYVTVAQYMTSDMRGMERADSRSLVGIEYYSIKTRSNGATALQIIHTCIMNVIHCPKEVYIARKQVTGAFIYYTTRNSDLDNELSPNWNCYSRCLYIFPICISSDFL